MIHNTWIYTRSFTACPHTSSLLLVFDKVFTHLILSQQNNGYLMQFSHKIYLHAGLQCPFLLRAIQNKNGLSLEIVGKSFQTWSELSGVRPGHPQFLLTIRGQDLKSFCLLVTLSKWMIPELLRSDARYLMYCWIGMNYLGPINSSAF